MHVALKRTVLALVKFIGLSTPQHLALRRGSKGVGRSELFLAARVPKEDTQGMGNLDDLSRCEGSIGARLTCAGRLWGPCADAISGHLSMMLRKLELILGPR